MLYLLIKIPVRLALRFFCRHIESPRGGPYKRKGPMLVVANHPNSFLDAIIIGSQFRYPVHFLARGDAFTKPVHRRLLGLLNMIPVYRLSEGKDKLALNGYAFRKCREILSEGGIVLIFIEGICVNSHDLQPFRKGAARIAAENAELPGFAVLPLGIAYSSLRDTGKTVRLLPGEPIPVTDLMPYREEARNFRHFNAHLLQVLAPLVQVPVARNAAALERALLLLPACAGYALHVFPYRLLRKLVARSTRGSVFYDSVLFAALFLLYPLLLLLLSALLFWLSAPAAWQLLVWIGIPFSAWSASRLWN